ncbi:hypothetical protein B0T25DRAFT_155356 [Lasiosphaeria hispida]|uniref:Glutathione S-transferase n=1 Tax=Lasiosphaeria hispida TaxID=260671 RepID=A0AAJ0MG25_9PEZI|nr:hypothetical protein B0T25DRAFT_155356 [Lasiosphaeria hispida]
MSQDTPKVVLHWLNGSRALATTWLLEELEIPYELDIHHRLPNAMAPPELEELHILGKSPVLSITPPGSSERIVLAESAFITQYLSDHFATGKTLVPTRWKDGQEGRVGGETESWMRYQYLLYYIEGSFMATMVHNVIFTGLKGPRIPFFIRPFTRLLANQLIAMLVIPNMKRHFALLERYLATSPDGGSYICGINLTSADILLSFRLLAFDEAGAFEEMWAWEKTPFKESYPKLQAYMELLSNEPGWKRALEKVTKIEGSCPLLP